MLTSLAVLVLALSPLAVVALLLELAARRQQRISGAVARQIALTDAIAEQFGAVVAPVVTRPVWGPWRIRIAVPLARPATTSRILAIAQRVLDRLCADGYELVLTPQAASAPAASSVGFAPRLPQAKAA